MFLEPFLRHLLGLPDVFLTRVEGNLVKPMEFATFSAGRNNAVHGELGKVANLSHSVYNIIFLRIECLYALGIDVI
ncbi:hypothetical protein MT325_m516L [Paramecium bursaria chlorella virus MT325]|uniref:Uncharacterized protein m516L n=1 Tax=Paramecium bursaria Chlorella virus MT325 TaxID=346932 RepID=A7IUP6_PBCVM|nr:hypothetical protein MT325_m516L [Paramecium bursaria chlorella virus MT325]